MKSIELFAGIGGIALATEWAGIETVAFCEQNTFCQKVLAKNFPNKPIYDDVCTLTKETLIKDGVMTHDGTIDIISGGYPCQPFSLAGKQRGEADERYLWGEFFRLVKEIRPTWVVGENVYGHVNNGLSVVVSDLEGEGYEVRAIVLPAADVGAPHKRERVFVVACHPDRQPVVQEDSTISTVGSERETWQSVTWKHWREFSELHWSVPEPGICRVDDGIAKGMDRDRLIALGNAVVPQQIYPVFKMIANYQKQLI